MSGIFASVKTESARDFENKRENKRITKSRFNCLHCEEIQHHLY